MRKECRGIMTLLMLVLSSAVNGQSQLEKHLTGVWKPLKLYDMGAVIPDASRQPIELMQKRLLESKFHFKEDYRFSFDSPVKEMVIENGHWKILPDNGQIVIQEWADRDKPRAILMGITVLLKDGETIFMLEETFFAFEMVRVSQ